MTQNRQLQHAHKQDLQLAESTDSNWHLLHAENKYAVVKQHIQEQLMQEQHIEQQYKEQQYKEKQYKEQQHIEQQPAQPQPIQRAREQGQPAKEHGAQPQPENAGRRRHVLGITGGVGAGKSMVLTYLAEKHGACVIQCDEVAAQLQRPGGACYDDMRALLPAHTVCSDGSFDRAAVAACVFADKEMLSRLNGIVHPQVQSEVVRQIKAHEGQLVVVEAALLLETGYRAVCDEIWYVRAPEEIRAKRLMESRGYGPERISRMMASQKDDAFYVKGTDLVIENGGDPSQTFEQIDRGLEEHGFMYDRKREQR